METYKIVKVRKRLQKVKIVEIDDNITLKVVKKKLCQIVPVGHKVYIEFDKKRTVKTLIDLTDVFNKKDFYAHSDLYKEK